MRSCKNIDSSKFKNKEVQQSEGVFSRYEQSPAVTEADSYSDEFDKQEWQINNEAKRIRMEDSTKERRLNDLYGEYVDCEPCIPPSETFRVELPSYIVPVDKTYIKSQLTQFKLVEERAKETAR